MRMKAFAHTSALWVCLLTACGDSSSHGTILCADAGASLPETVSKAIDAKGGKLEAKGVTLEIPAGALSKMVMITATKVAIDKDAEDTNSKMVSDVYKFGPEGTKFDKDVKVSFTTDKPEPDAVVYFTKENSSDYEKLESEADEKSVSAKVKHFSQGFAGIPPADDLDAGMTELDASVTPDAATPEAAPTPQRVIVRSRDSYGFDVNASWAAYQDGDGAWQALSQPQREGLYQVDVLHSRFGLALVCYSGGQSYGSLVYGTTADTVLDVVIQGGGCEKGNYQPTYPVTGTLNMPGNDSAFRYGNALGASDNLTPPDFTIYSYYGKTDDYMFGALGPAGLDRVLFVRDFTAYGNSTNNNFDFVTNGSAVGTAQLTVNNTSSAFSPTVTYTTRGSNYGMSVLQTVSVGQPPVQYAQFATIASDQRRPSDRYVFEVNEPSDGPNSRSVTYTTYAGGNQTLTLLDNVTPTIAIVKGSYAVTFDDVAGATDYRVSWGANDGQSNFEMLYSAAWLQGKGPHTLTFPDLSTASGYQTQWGPPDFSVDGGYAYMNVTFEAQINKSDANGVLQSRASFYQDLPMGSVGL